MVEALGYEDKVYKLTGSNIVPEKIVLKKEPLFLTEESLVNRADGGKTYKGNEVGATSVLKNGQFEMCIRDRLVLDGGGHTIRNLKVNTSSSVNQGFFGLLVGKCSNINFENAQITANTKMAGILAGQVGAATSPGIDVYKRQTHGSSLIRQPIEAEGKNPKRRPGANFSEPV